jgi:hypothetical protein
MSLILGIKQKKCDIPYRTQAPARRPEGEELKITIMVIRVLQHNCQRSVDAMTTFMAKAAGMAEVVLI